MAQGFLHSLTEELINRLFLGWKKPTTPAETRPAPPLPPPPAPTYAQPIVTPRARTAPTPAPPPQPPPKQPRPALDGAILGQAIETTAPLTLPAKTRERHLYLIGKSGTGKTTLIKNLIIQDMNAGAGVCFVDPHGDAATELLANVSPHRLKDVIYFDPASEYAPAFNPLALPYDPSKLTEDILSSFKMFFSNSWGPRLEHLLRFGVLTLITHGVPHTLKDLQTLFLRREWREQLADRHPDKAIRDFWQYEFPTMEKAAVNPILNKLSPLLMPRSPMQRIFSQRENDLNFSEILNNQKILIVNLSKGKLGDAPAFLLGGLIVTGIQQAALARADIPERARKDFFLYVDEFQNYTVESFNSILAEARKYRLFLTLAHQNLGQLPRDLEHNIFGNVATLVAFGVSSEDARSLQHEMHRSRYSFRAKNTSEQLTFEQALASLKATLAENIAYCKEKFDDSVKKLGEAHHLDPADDDRTVTKIYMDLIHDYRNDLWDYEQRWERLHANPDFSNPSVLREIFTDFEVKQTSFPDVDDFINLSPHHAFARIERAENVTAFKTNPPPPPVAGIRGQILHAMRAQHEQREKARLQAREVPRPRAPQATPAPASVAKPSLAPPTLAATKTPTPPPLSTNGAPTIAGEEHGQDHAPRRRARRARAKAKKKGVDPSRINF